MILGCSMRFPPGAFAALKSRGQHAHFVPCQPRRLGDGETFWCTFAPRESQACKPHADNATASVRIAGQSSSAYTVQSMGSGHGLAPGVPIGRSDPSTPPPSPHLSLVWHHLRQVEPWPPTPDGLSFVLVTRGTGDFVTSKWAQRLVAGDLYIANGTAGTVGPAAAQEELTLGTFSLRFEQLYPLFDSGEVPALQAVLETFREFKHYPASTAVATRSHQLLHEVIPAFNLCHRSQLLTIASVALSEEFSLARQQRPAFLCPERHLATAFENLSLDQILTIPLRELGPRFGCSRRHLNRVFQQCFGRSFADLRMELRLLKAASLLRDLDAKVIDVAEECGFHHLGLFNHCFKRRFGATPGRWRDARERSPAETSGLSEPDTPCPLRSNGLCPWRARRTDPHLPDPKAGL